MTRYLFERRAFDAVQDPGNALVRIQSIQRSIQVTQVALTGIHTRGRNASELETEEAPSSPPSEDLSRMTHGDADEPRANFHSTFRGRPGRGIDERLLHDVVEVGVVAHDAIHGAGEIPSVTCVQIGERAIVTPAHALEEHGVRRRNRRREGSLLGSHGSYYCSTRASRISSRILRASG
jgi:hypothetical protein